MTSKFLNIPLELQVHILCYLDAVSLVRSAMTCRYLNDTLKNSSPLTYIIQLNLDGLEHVGAHVPASDAIALLLRRRQAWLSLEWTAHIAFEIQHNSIVYDLVGGTFTYRNNDNLEMVQLHTLKADKKHVVRRTLDGTDIPYFAMDPTQDLMVSLVDAGSSPSTLDASVAQIHIRTISGDVPHPLALKDSLEFNFDGTHGRTIIEKCSILEIAYNILALSFKKSFVLEEVRVLIWDWTTSELLLDTAISSDLSTEYSQRCSISLLDSTHFIFACLADSGSIQLYKLERSASVGNATAAHLATFHLPPLRPHSDIRSISIGTEQILAHPLPHTPCLTNNEDRLYMFAIIYDHWDPDSLSDDGKTACASMFVHQRAFAKYISQRAHPGGLPLDIPWAEWGPLNTRFIFPELERPLRLSERSIHGQRVIFLSGERSSRTSMEILDFSLAALLSANGHLPIQSALSCETDRWTLSSSSFISASSIGFLFVGEIRTYLPYACIKMDIKQEYSEVLIHADGVVGVKLPYDQSFSAHVYTF